MRTAAELREKIETHLKRLDHIDEDYVHRTSDEMYKWQPFMISMFLGYRLDVNDAELGEIMKQFFLIWECFKDEKNIRTIQLTEATYEKAHSRNLKFLKALENLSEENKKERLTNSDPHGLSVRSQYLLGSVLAAFHTTPVLHQMRIEKKMAILVGLKTLVQSLDALTLRK